MLGQRRRRWPTIKPILVEYIVFAEEWCTSQEITSYFILFLVKLYSYL